LIENYILEIEDSIIGGWDAVMLRIKGQMILFRKQLLRKLLFRKSYYKNYYSENSYDVNYYSEK